MSNRLATSLMALSVGLASPAMADVTAADVWSNQQALFAAMGGTLSGDISSGTVDPELNFIFPMGAGSFQIKASGLQMVENGDGSVTITYPSPMTITMAGGIASEASFAVDLTMINGSYSSVATGDPGDVAYETTASDVRIEVSNLELDSGVATPEISMTGVVELTSWDNASRITEGNVITYAVTSNTGESTADFEFGADNIRSTSVQKTLPLSGTLTATLPVGGFDVMNISAALRNGFSFTAESTGEGSASVSETFLGDELLNRQSTTTGTQTADMSFDENGMVVNAEAVDFALSMFDPLVFPGELDFAMEAISANYEVPLNASEDTQDFRVATSMSGITMGDTIWNLFDPAGQLPRDPAEITFDITGIGTNGMDLLDFAAMSQMFGPPPIQVDEVTVENLKISVAGAEARAEGGFTFDWTDFGTIPGMPRPEGKVTVNLDGANTLMDNLVAMGLIPEQDLMMPRMMMGMFATPVGDDQLESVIEVNDQGHVLANGQRLQ